MDNGSKATLDTLKATTDMGVIQVIVKGQTVDALLIGYSFANNQFLYEAEIPETIRKPRKPKTENTIPAGPQTVKAGGTKK